MPTVLESLLDPIRPAEFREQYYGKQPLFIRGDAKKFADLFTWDDLNRLLNSSPYAQPHVEISTATKRKQAASPQTIIEECRAGASLIVHHLHLCDEKVGELTRALEADTGEPMTASLFLSHPSETALARHYDKHDVFVLHLHGRKAWSVYAEPVEKPLIGLSESARKAPAEVVLECDVAAGDVLYVPRGFWHQARAQGGFSLQITVAMDSRMGLDYLTWLVDELRNDVRFRDELPLSFACEPPAMREQRLREHLRRLEDIVVSRFTDRRTVQSFIDHCVGSDRDVREFKFPEQLFEAPVTELDVRHFSRPSRQRFVLDEVAAEGTLTLIVWGQMFQFATSAKPLIEFIFSNTQFSDADALSHAGAMTEQEVHDLLNRLLREGILDAAHGA